MLNISAFRNLIYWLLWNWQNQ